MQFFTGLFAYSNVKRGNMKKTIVTFPSFIYLVFMKDKPIKKQLFLLTSNKS